MRYGCVSAVAHDGLVLRQDNHMRARFVTTALVALGAVVVGALGIAVTLATSDSIKWPAWLRPYHRWGWWAVLVLLVVAAIFAAWQFTHQLRGHPMPPATELIRRPPTQRAARALSLRIRRGGTHRRAHHEPAAAQPGVYRPH